MINSKNFDNIRTVALLFILLIHTTLANTGFSNFDNESTEKVLNENFEQLFMSGVYVNLFKAGTVLFFIISGFLFEMQFEKFNNFSLFVKRKAKSLLRPYLIIFIIPTLIITGIIEPNVGFRENIDIYEFLSRCLKNIFLTNYWFVPALFVTLIINYFIKTKDLLKALCLFIPIWIIAYFNIYFEFALSYHTIWFPAFFFVFTLGRLMCVYNEQISRLSLIRDQKKLLLFIVFFYCISNLESVFIMDYGNNPDFCNTLKIGNILFSLSLFYFLNNFFNKVKFVLPIKVSFYFIYLIHPFVLKITNYFMVKKNIVFFEYPYQFLYNVLHFLIVLTICVVIQQIFFKLSFKSKALSEYVFKK